MRGPGADEIERKIAARKKPSKLSSKEVLWQQGCGLCAVCPTSQRPPSPTSARPGKHGLSLAECNRPSCL